jgi:tetratricopeptide (TPR) repeat protein
MRDRARAFLLAGTLGAGIAFAQQAGSLQSAAEWNNRAVEFANQGRYEQAESLYRHAIEAARDNDLIRAKIATNLGTLYQREDRYRDAEPLFRSALELRRRQLGPTSAEVAYSLNNLGEVYRLEGRDAEARNLMEAAVRGLRQHHPDAPGLPVIMSNLAVVRGCYEDFGAAEDLLRSALTIYDRLGRQSGREYGVSLTDLADVLVAQNRLDAAQQLFEQAVQTLDGAADASHRDLASALAGLGELYRRTNRTELALHTEQRALDLLDPAGDTALKAQILRHLGNIAAGSGDAPGSLRYFEQALALEEKTLGDGHPSTAALLLDYASATGRAGYKSLARKLRKRAQEAIARLNAQSADWMTVSVKALRDPK